MTRAKYGGTVVVHCKAKSGNSTAMTASSGGRNLKFTLGAGHAIEDIEKTVVGVDTNHPLSDRDLVFSVKLVDIV